MKIRTGRLSRSAADEASDQRYAVFRSVDYTGTNYDPYLRIEYTAVPIPAAAWLLGSGLIGLVAIRRKFKKN